VSATEFRIGQTGRMSEKYFSEISKAVLCEYVN